MNFNLVKIFIQIISSRIQFPMIKENINKQEKKDSFIYFCLNLYEKKKFTFKIGYFVLFFGIWYDLILGTF